MRWFLSVPLLVALVPAAHAATLGGAVVDALSPAIGTLVSTLAIVIVGWLSELARRFLGKAIEEKDRDALQAALTNAAGVLLNQLRGRTLLSPIKVGDPLVATAVDYVTAAVPDAVKRFGLQPAQIGEKIIAKAALARPGVRAEPAGG